MDGENLTASTEVLNHSEDVLAHLVAAFRPCAYTERQAPVFTSAGDLIGAADPVIVGEDLGDAVHHGHGRIVGMEGETHVRLLRYRQHRLNEISVIGPDII